MEYTKSIVNKIADDWILETDDLHCEMLLENYERYFDGILCHVRDESLSYGALELLAQENYEYLRQSSHELYTVEDIRDCLTSMLVDMVKVETMNRLAEDNAIVSLLKNKILEEWVSTEVLEAA